jgi:hypothetical protein
MVAIASNEKIGDSLCFIFLSMQLKIISSALYYI